MFQNSRYSIVVNIALFLAGHIFCSSPRIPRCRRLLPYWPWQPLFTVHGSCFVIIAQRKPAQIPTNRCFWGLYPLLPAFCF